MDRKQAGNCEFGSVMDIRINIKLALDLIRFWYGMVFGLVRDVNGYESRSIYRKPISNHLWYIMVRSISAYALNLPQAAKSNSLGGYTMYYASSAQIKGVISRATESIHTSYFVRHCRIWNKIDICRTFWENTYQRSTLTRKKHSSRANAYEAGVW